MRLSKFDFLFANAWLRADRGISTQLENDNGNASIVFIVNNSQKFVLDLSEREDEFICDIENYTKDMNFNFYEKDYCDGLLWRINICYDDKMICTVGANAFPKSFVALLEFFHSLGVPKCYHENTKFYNMLKNDEHYKMEDIKGWIDKIQRTDS